MHYFSLHPIRKGERAEWACPHCNRTQSVPDEMRHLKALMCEGCSAVYEAVGAVIPYGHTPLVYKAVYRCSRPLERYYHSEGMHHTLLMQYAMRGSEGSSRARYYRDHRVVYDYTLAWQCPYCGTGHKAESTSADKWPPAEKYLGCKGCKTLFQGEDLGKAWWDTKYQPLLSMYQPTVYVMVKYHPTNVTRGMMLFDS